MRAETMYHKLRSKALACLVILCVALMMFGALHQAQAAKQQNFASAEDAVTALVKAVQTDNTASLLEILGPGAEALVTSGDPVADATGRKNFLAAYAASHSLAAQPDGSMVLTIGENGWPMPIPIVQAGKGWQFDSTTGAQDIVDRRIGGNELKTIQTLLSCVDAEQDYFDRLKRGTGTGAFAQRVISSTGTQDGLYWDAADGEAESPLGPLIDQGEDEGYPGAAAPNGKQYPYHGYFFRILKSQGPDAPGGAKAYIENGQMMEGFAFIAWPAVYESSGVMTFLVNQDGIVFQKDLGSNTAKTASATAQFNPDLSWARVDISN